MDFKDYIKAGNKVLHVPYEWSCLQSLRPEVVTIGEYKPYYTDGEMADPTPDEYEGCCFVEVTDTHYDESHIQLDRLFPIEPKQESVLYNGKVCQTYGYANGCDVCEQYADEDHLTDYCILKKGEELVVVYDDDVCTPRAIEDLTKEELERLHGDIIRGSIYTSDYRNSLDVPDEVAMDGYERFWLYLREKYGENAADEHDSAKEFAECYQSLLN